MSITVDHCRAMAEEADRLAGIVSYSRDKVRLRQQADGWRAKAQALEACPRMETPTHPTFMDRLRRRFGFR